MFPGSPARLALRIGRTAAAAVALAFAAGPLVPANAAWPFAAKAAAEPSHEIKAPYYGDALFYFFQDRYFTSITTLMASQQIDRLVHHDDEAEILRGGMLASYGLTKEAGEIFSTMVARGASPSVRDRAWFYLAKIRYQRGYLPEAEEALSKVENKLSRELEEERGLLLAQLLMLRSDYAGAAGALRGLPMKGPGARYVRYNLGIALLKSGDPKRGTELLNELGKESAPTE
jgi:tetratricopeptide (TPR) repeat protein